MVAVEKRPSTIELVERLKAAGWRKHAGLVFSLPLEGADTQDADGEVARGRVSFNVASFGVSDSAQVNPLVGVVHPGVERLVAQYRDLPYRRYGASTVGTNLGYLGGREGSWTVPAEATPTASRQIDAILGRLDSHGIPWMRQHATLEQILSAARNDDQHDWYTPYRVPVVLRLLGRDEEALAYVDRMERGDFELVAEDAAAFATRFRADGG